MKIEGVIFDLDGTLVDTIEDIGDATNTLLKKHGYPQYTTEDFIRWIGNGAAKFLEEAMGEEVEQQVSLVADLILPQARRVRA